MVSSGPRIRVSLGPGSGKTSNLAFAVDDPVLGKAFLGDVLQPASNVVGADHHAVALAEDHVTARLIEGHIARASLGSRDASPSFSDEPLLHAATVHFVTAQHAS